MSKFRTPEAEKAEGRPSADLVVDAQIQYQDDDFKVGDFDEWRSNWSSGVRVDIPLLDGMRTVAQVAQASEDLRRLDFEQQKLQSIVRLEIRQAGMALREALEQLKTRREPVRQAARGLSIAESRYTSGAGTQLEMLDAQLALVEPKTALATAQRDRAFAVADLERFLGVLSE